MPRFVVLYHELPEHASRESHWDLMLEDAGSLLTWELSQALDQATDWQMCQQLEDHRIAYLDYEGALSDDRGHVTRWDAGKFVWESRSDSSIQVSLAGTKLLGTLFLAKRLRSWRYRFAD